MKLRSITLTNVRRFAGTTACLDGLGDGLNVVGAPNEAGKSTFFEALQALLFLPPVRRRRGPRRSAPTPAARPRSRPRSSSPAPASASPSAGCSAPRPRHRAALRPGARPGRRGRALDPERIAGDGPAELLWVRQGTLALEPEGRNPAEKAEQDRLPASAATCSRRSRASSTR